MKRLNFFLKIFAVMFFFLSASVYGEGKIIYGNNTLVNREVKLDINSATKEDMLRNGISTGYVAKIFEYREITGGFLELSEMKRIKGIGDATYQKLIKKFKVEGDFTPKKYNINKADEKVLVYMGYSKEEIKNIRKHIAQEGKIQNNLELMKLISKKKYEKQRDFIDY
ncbi:MAG: ComEA family DNA-binding protein [Fusobacteriaceae bacterium]